MSARRAFARERRCVLARRGSVKCETVRLASGDASGSRRKKRFRQGDEKSNQKSQKAVGRTDDRPHRDRGRRDNARPLRARGIVRGVPTAAAHQSRIDRGGDT
jgi:hypothetical protein